MRRIRGRLYLCVVSTIFLGNALRQISETSPCSVFFDMLGNYIFFLSDSQKCVQICMYACTLSKCIWWQRMWVFWRIKTSYVRAGRKIVNTLLNVPTCIDSGNLTVCYIWLSWQKKKALSKSLRPTNKHFSAYPSNSLAMSQLSFLNCVATYALSQSCHNKLVFQGQQFSLHYLPGNLYEVIHPVTTLFFFLVFSAHLLWRRYSIL